MRKIAPYDTQLELFQHNRVINATCTADARNAYGEAAQDIVRAVLGLQAIRINGSFTTCFDAYKEGIYYEIKSVKSGGKVVCYDWRMEKEANSGVPLTYAILIHVIRGEREDIIGKMSNTPLKILSIPEASVHSVAYEQVLNVHKKFTSKRNGFNRAGYSEGYRNVPVNKLWEMLGVERILENPFGGTILWREIVREGS